MPKGTRSSFRRGLFQLGNPRYCQTSRDRPADQQRQTGPVLCPGPGTAKTDCPMQHEHAGLFRTFAALAMGQAADYDFRGSRGSMRLRSTVIVLFITHASIANAADPVIAWNEAAAAAIRIEQTPPPLAARAFAILHGAIYDAVNGVTRRHAPFFVQRAAPPRTAPDVAVIAAGHRILTQLFPNQASAFDALKHALLTVRGGNHPVRDALAWGTTVADEILLWRANDGWDGAVAVPDGTGPGVWVPTPPAYAAYLLPQWGFVTPFALPAGDFVRPTGPPPLTSEMYAADYTAVKALGAAERSVRTVEQDVIALFWADGGGTETPPGHWNRIGRDVTRTIGNTLEGNARLFAVLNVAMADAGIAAWDAKFAYLFWRPITAIHHGDQDDNPSTDPDPSWSSFLVTPPFPEYVSGHSTFSGAAARVLAAYYGTDAVAFTTGSDALPEVVRSFPGFSAAAAEAAVSRLYGGIHFPSAIQDGLTMGTAIGDWTVAHMLGRLSRWAHAEQAHSSRAGLPAFTFGFDLLLKRAVPAPTAAEHVPSP
jgi:hypothetical protein